MQDLKIGEQIALLRKGKGLTQEELGQLFGVTNQTISKWEAGICCPDIQLLPEIAHYFGVSIDTLMGVQSVNTYSNLYLQIKRLFEQTPEDEVFQLAYQFASLLHEGACTRGYKGFVPWNTSQSTEDEVPSYQNWNCSICSEPEGSTVHRNHTVVITSHLKEKPISKLELREIVNQLKLYSVYTVLTVLFAIYELTRSDFERFVSIKEIAKLSHLHEESIRAVLAELPLEEQEEAGDVLYRMEGYFMHVPDLLRLFAMK